MRWSLIQLRFIRAKKLEHKKEITSFLLSDTGNKYFWQTHVLLILSVVYQTIVTNKPFWQKSCRRIGLKVCLFVHWKHLVLYWKEIFIPLVSPLIYTQCRNNPISVYSMILPRPTWRHKMSWNAFWRGMQVWNFWPSVSILKALFLICTSNPFNISSENLRKSLGFH